MRLSRDWFWGRILVLALVITLLQCQSFAAPAKTPSGLMLTLRLPITGNRDVQLESAILKNLETLKEDPTVRGVLVIRFNNPDDDGQLGSDFGRSLDLARFLTSERLSGVKTVAFLPNGVKGHAVLAALACEEIIMPANAMLGPANANEPVIDDAMRAAYREIALRRKTVPPAVALGFLDPASKVIRASTEDGEQYVTVQELPALRESVTVLETEAVGPTPLEMTGRQGREMGFVARLGTTPADVAKGLGIDDVSLRVDAKSDGGWQPAVVAIRGPITADTIVRTKARLAQALDSGANLLCLRIDSPGGSPNQSIILSTWLAELEASEVRTVAYVPREARSDAALIAMACDELVMHPEAVLGGEGAATLSDRQAQAVAIAWRDGVAGVRGISWSLPVALALPGITIERAVQSTTGRVEYFSEEELASLRDRELWEVGDRVGVGPLQLTGQTAEKMGLVTHLVDSFGGLRDAYGLTDDIPFAEPRWSDTLLDALASPSLAWILLFIGGAGLYIELQTPGLGLGGFVAMVAFIIYFWSQYLHGTAGWLEVMLFIAGVFCVAAEIFVLPGFGVLGLGGGVLVISSLVLASQTFIVPANDYQMRQLRWSLLGLLGAVMGVALFASVVRRWLPATPVLRNVLLPPPNSNDTFHSEMTDELVGIEGITTTRLAPAGKARLSGSVYNVFADDDLIEPGVPVRVVEVKGRRIMVRSLET